MPAVGDAGNPHGGQGTNEILRLLIALEGLKGPAKTLKGTLRFVLSHSLVLNLVRFEGEPCGNALPCSVHCRAAGV